MTDGAEQFDPLAEFEDEEPTNEETYAALRRSIARTAGFGLKFLECTPAIARETIGQLREDLPQKKIAVLELDEPIVQLFERVVEFTAEDTPDVLFVLGLERSLVEDISPGGSGGQGDYYQEDRTPGILSHLNQNREKFRKTFGFCLVLVLPRFAKKYFVRRAADFVDWGSGVFEWRLDRDLVDWEAFQVLQSGEYDEYLQMTEAEQREERIKLQTWLEESENKNQRYKLLIRLGSLFHASQKFDLAIESYICALEIYPASSEAWYCRGNALSWLSQFDRALRSYDRALELDSSLGDAWYYRGNALSWLNQYEVAIESYDRATELNSNLVDAWYARGNVLGLLNRYDAAVESYNRALELEPSFSDAWYYRDNILARLSRRDAEVKSCDRTLEFEVER